MRNYLVTANGQHWKGQAPNAPMAAKLAGMALGLSTGTFVTVSGTNGISCLSGRTFTI